MSQDTPGPDHAAQTPPFWENPAFRTVVQGILLDLLLALCLVIYNATSSNNDIDWALLWLSLIKTALMTLASSIMRRVRPRTVPDV